MTTDATGELLNAIGQHVANILGKTPDDVFVFIRAADQCCSGAIFENQKSEVQYHEFGPETVDVILELWDAAEPDKKWSILLYDIKNGRFSVEYIYPDQLDPDESDIDQREHFLVARYGDKPVIYPDLDDGEWDDLTEDDLTDDEAPRDPAPRDVDPEG